MSVDSKLLKSGKVPPPSYKKEYGGIKKPKSKPTMADVAGGRIKSPKRKGYTPVIDRKKTMKKGIYKKP